jgi:hypothetical protein
MFEEKYDLCYAFQPDEFESMIAKIESLLVLDGLKNLWADKRDRFLKDSIDPTGFLVRFIEDYPRVRGRRLLQKQTEKLR